MIQTSRISTNAPGAATHNNLGDTLWSNVTNALVQDGANAHWGASGGGQRSDTLAITNFGFNIPSIGVVDGVVVSVVGSSFSAYHSMQLVYGSTVSSDLGGFYDIQPSYGSSTNLWGLTITPANVNDTTFGVNISAGDISGGDAIANIDYVSITVYWHYDVTATATDVPLRYDYKIYAQNGAFLGNIPNVVSEFAKSNDINSAGSQVRIDVAGDIDSSTPIFAPGALTRWLPGSWSYRQKITILRSKVTADIAGFPVYIDLSSMNSQFWTQVKSDGSDIRMTNTYGSAELPYELTNFSVTNKTGIIWFRADLLSASYDNVFYLYYGNSSASAYASSATYGSQNVWSDYAGVWHFDDGTTLSTADSTSNARNLTNTGVVAAAAKINGGANLADNTDILTLSSPLSLSAGTYTFSTWFKYPLPNNVTGQWNTFARGTNSTTPEGDHIVIVNVANQQIGYYDNSTGGLGFLSSGYALSGLSTGMHHLVATTSGTTTKFYIDGVYRGASSKRSTTNLSVIGNYQVGSQQSGILDETRFTMLERTSAWSAAEYANQNSPSTFYTIGNAELATTMNTDAILRNGNNINIYETSYYYPNGKLMFQGQINRVTAKFGAKANSLVRIICHGDGRDLDNMVARGAPFSYTSQVSQTTQDSRVSDIYYSRTSGGGWQQYGQTFTTGASQTNIGRIQVMLDGIADATLRVFTNAATTTQLGSVTKSVNAPGATVVSFEFSDFITVTPSTTYFFDVVTAQGQSIWVWYKASSNPYAGGSMYVSSYSGGSGGGAYAISTNNDLYFTVSSGTPSTQATYSSQDPTSGMLVKIMDDAVARGSLISYNATDIQATGLSLTATFNTNTIYEAIQKIRDMSPSGYYWYVDEGTNKLVFKDTSRSADIILVKGRHIGELDLDFSIENVANDFLFSGGATSGVNLYSEYTDSNSRSMYGNRLDRKSDNRVTIQGTADAIGNSAIATNKDEQYYTTLQVYAKTMDITLFKPGKTIGFRGYGNFIDNMLLQATRVDYTPKVAQIQVGTLPRRFSSDAEQVVRGLIAEQTIANPSTPS